MARSSISNGLHNRGTGAEVVVIQAVTGARAGREAAGQESQSAKSSGCAGWPWPAPYAAPGLPGSKKRMHGLGAALTCSCRCLRYEKGVSAERVKRVRGTKWLTKRVPRGTATRWGQTVASTAWVPRKSSDWGVSPMAGMARFGPFDFWPAAA
jgi:hypothetical protein